MFHRVKLAFTSRESFFGNCEEELPKTPVGRQSADSRPTVGRLSADRRPTGFA